MLNVKLVVPADAFQSEREEAERRETGTVFNRTDEIRLQMRKRPHAGWLVGGREHCFLKLRRLNN